MIRLMAVILCLLTLTSQGEARARHHYHAAGVASVGPHHFVRHYRGFRGEVAVAHNDGRPSAWCGWFMRRNVGADPGPDYNLARNWAHWGHAASGPAPGVIGVMPHHVFKVVEVLAQGMVLAISGNDGHAVRTRPRSTSSVIAWRAG